MNEQFNKIMDRRHNGSMKWEAPYIKKRFQIDIDDHTEIFPMFIADMDFIMDEKIRNEMMKLYENPDFGYFHVQVSFYESIVNWYRDIHHIDIKKEWIVESVGTIASMHLACDMVARNKGVVYMTPVYGPFANCAKIGKGYKLPLLYQKGRYDIDFEGLERLLKNEEICVLLMCNPHNPGGRAWTRDELKHIVELCKEYHVTILSDEIHADVKINDSFVSLIEFSDLYDQMIVSSSPNKTFNISGLSTSFILCASQELRQRYIDYMGRLHIGVNRLGIDMIEIVYTYGNEWYQELVKVIQYNVEQVMNCLKITDIEVMKPDGGFLIWMKLPKVKDVDRFILDLAKETHVLLETGARFVDDYEGWIRVNVGTSPRLVQEAMERFVEFYNGY